MAILSVRDATTNPPTFYKPKQHNIAEFWEDSQVYAVIEGNQVNAPQIWIPNAVATTLTIHYHSQHNPNLSDNDVVTVPPIHHDLLELYAVWQAWLARRETAVSQFAKGDIQKEEFDRITGRTYATRLDYFTAVSQVGKYLSGQSAVIRWRTDELDKVY